MKHKVSYKITDEQNETLEMYLAKFPDKSKSDILRELLSKALGISKQTVQSVGSPLPEKASVSSSSSSNSTSESSLGENPSELPKCVYRTDLGDGNILCKELKKVPLAACLTRQKRYVHMGHNCRPIGEKPKRTPKKYEDKSKWFDNTKIYRGR